MERRAVALAAVLVLAALAGCTGGDERVTVSGSPATLAADGYEHVGTENRSVRERVTVVLEGDVEGRESVDVNATVPVATYRRGDPPTVVGVAASPHVEVIENPPKGSDPLAERSPADLAAFVQGEYTEVGDLTEAGTRTVSMLGEEVEATTYEATATRGGDEVAVRVDVARVRHEGDVVTAVVVRPADSSFPAAAFEGVQH